MTYFGSKMALAGPAIVLILTASTAFATQQTSEAPIELVRKTVQREIDASDGEQKAMFTDRKQTAHGSQTTLMVETRQGMVGLMVAVNDKPLTPQQHQAEEEHLAGLVNNPEQLKKKQRSEKEDAERITKIMKALPDAFIYEADGSEVGSQKVGGGGDHLVRLTFRPNPRYDPPSHVEQVLTGMQGYLLIDADKCRIAKIDGTLIKDVGFGWGILGHLDKGGRFLVMQAEVFKDRWEVTHMTLSFTGRILLFKSLKVNSDDVFSNFRPVPSDMTFAQGVALVKKQQSELAENQPQAGDPK